MNEKMLFVGHSASRSGAPMILLNLLRWLRQNTSLRFDVGLLESGPLLPAFESVAPTEILAPPPALAKRVVRKLVGAERVARRDERRLARRLIAADYDLAYVNTIVPTKQMHALASVGIPVICHVHELDFAMMHMVGEAGIERVLPRVAHFIAASNAVSRYLVTRWRIPEAKVTVVHEFTVDIPSEESVSAARRRVRSELRLNDSTTLIGSCGTLDWRKGADLFVQVARLMTSGPIATDARFIWVGADPSSPDTREFLHDVRACGLSDRVTVIASSPNPGDYFAAMDVFALTSREDPFPLVMLEAAASGLPLVCFADSGGGPEFAEHDAGLIAPYLDVAGFAERATTLAQSVELRRRLGEAAKLKVQARFTIATQAPKILDVINRVAAAQKR